MCCSTTSYKFVCNDTHIIRIKWKHDYFNKKKKLYYYRFKKWPNSSARVEKIK